MRFDGVEARVQGTQPRPNLKNSTRTNNAEEPQEEACDMGWLTGPNTHTETHAAKVVCAAKGQRSSLKLTSRKLFPL